jgi:two-component system NtrC family sensor kinase
MAQELRRAQRENEQLAASLESKVQEKTRELERTRAHLVHNEKMASLGKLSAVIAHEINNPLAGIFTYARLISRRLRHDSLDAEARARLCEHIEMIESETRRCGETVKNLLLFSKLEPGAMGQVKVGEIIQRAARLLQHSFDLNQVTLDVDLGTGDDRVAGNPDRLQQTLVALMVNASEAMPDGGRLGVTLDSSSDEHLTISVSDTGTGIPEELQSSIFEPFFTTKDGQGGVGLGLAIVHGIVRRHGGTITLESSPLSGTTFHVTLPRTPPEDPSLSRRQPEP